MTSQPLWIHRKLSDRIYDQIVADEPKIVVWLLQAPAGMGKTYLARDIGTRLSSPTGYEPAQQGRLLWSGILDLYDQAINSNRGIEQRLVEALSRAFEFDDYEAQRELYTSLFRGGISGAGLEEQRRKVEAAFAAGLQEVSKTGSPILVFDTTERLESASDPTQRVLGFADDTASVMGWLVAQITSLRSGTVLLLGREQERFSQLLSEKIEQANNDTTRAGLPPIDLRTVAIQPLDADELSLFFDNRASRFPPLKSLDADLKHILAHRTEGNPLLLDLALQTYLETAEPALLRETLTEQKAMSSLARTLIQAYMTSVENHERHLLLRYLALCRNGVFADLLRAMEPKRAERFIEALGAMEELPFIKVRNVVIEMPGQKSVQRRTYFLHDAMYSICDEALLKPQQAQDDSRQVLRWYEERIKEAGEFEEGRPRSEHRGVPAPDLMAESLFYSMRSDPVIGYSRYLLLADKLIRGAETGLDMRLHDALAQFITSATAEQHPALDQNAASPIDRENLHVLMPHLLDLYAIDSATLWIKRFTVRGKRDLAEEIGRAILPQVRQAYRDDPTLYRLTASDFLLWFGQALMYGSSVQEAVSMYEEAISLLEQKETSSVIEPSPTAELENLQRLRTMLVQGRLRNNLGYTYWMNFGQYSRAIIEFQIAIGLFQLADISEEYANSSDNLGRVYALQGRRFQAIQLIENGLEIRKGLGLSYREALSANSLAQGLTRFGEFDSALRAANDALAQFGRVGVKRGIGLGLLSRGMIYRNLAENWLDNSLSLDEGIKYADLAETDLRDAWRIFSSTVSEPIRLVQALNELGCSYRARYQLLRAKDDAQVVTNATFAQGRIRFLQAIKQANEAGFLIEQLDSMQDLAVLFFRAKAYDEVHQYLHEISRTIDATYPGHIITPSKGLPVLDQFARVDACYKLMGQIELLEGTLVYERGTEKAQVNNPTAKLPDTPDLLTAAEHFLLSVSYFNRYSGEDYARRLTYRRIYRRFKNCDPFLIQEIVDVYLPKWVKRYDLPEDLVRSYFVDVFGLFIRPGKREYLLP